MAFFDVIGHSCVYLDASVADFMKAAQHCVVGRIDKEKLLHQIRELWLSSANPNPVLPCLSVRTGLDLYLQVKNYPPGSEIIMSAINIPDMVQVVHHHKLKIVALDVQLDTCDPKLDLLDSLVTDKTVAILLAHIFGRRFNMDPYIAKAKKHNLTVIEDCAEAFCGYEVLSHRETDLGLFSFGAIKYFTSFGGGIAKVKDRDVFDKMLKINQSYPVQSQGEYLKKVLKYSLVYLVLNCPRIKRNSMAILNALMNYDPKPLAVSLLRGFPGDLIPKLRFQPSAPLIYMMHRRMTNYDPREIQSATARGDYVADKMPEGVTLVGSKADIRNYWLFPIVVDNPDELLKTLNALGVDAYRGATQLNIIEPDSGNTHLKHLHTFVTHYPHEAKFIIDHVVYLPVNKLVPFVDLDRICSAVEIAVNTCNTNGIGHGIGRPPPQQRIKLQSKL